MTTIASAVPRLLLLDQVTKQLSLSIRTVQSTVASFGPTAAAASSASLKRISSAVEGLAMPNGRQFPCLSLGCVCRADTSRVSSPARHRQAAAMMSKGTHRCACHIY